MGTNTDVQIIQFLSKTGIYLSKVYVIWYRVTPIRKTITLLHMTFERGKFRILNYKIYISMTHLQCVWVTGPWSRSGQIVKLTPNQIIQFRNRFKIYAVALEQNNFCIQLIYFISFITYYYNIYEWWRNQTMQFWHHLSYGAQGNLTFYSIYLRHSWT